MGGGPFAREMCEQNGRKLLKTGLVDLQEGAYSPETMAVGLARVGCEDQQIVAAPLAELQDVDFGPPLHSLIIAGQTHVIEDEILDLYKIAATRTD